jgi:hypothetical protein
MPQSKLLCSTGNGTYEVVSCGANTFIAFATSTDGSGKAIWSVGRCTSYDGSGFVAVLSVNVGTGVVSVNGTQLQVP